MAGITGWFSVTLNGLLTLRNFRDNSSEKSSMTPSTSIRLWFRHRIEWVKANPLLAVLLTILCGLLVVLFSAFVAVIFFKSVEVCIGRLLGSSNLDLFRKKEILTFLGIGMGGILLALQAVIANRRAKAMEGTAKAQAKATEEQAKANQNTERGQRQERLKNAIEHLGENSDSVRMGGAYELFHLAQDTEDLRQTVMDILCAHIRRTTGEAEYQEGKYKWKPSEEIQSLLTLMFVEDHEVFKGCRINLQGSWLNGVTLNRARLHRAKLFEVHLQGAYLSEAQLQEVNLNKACMQGTVLVMAHLQGAYLMLAQLHGSILIGAHLQGTNLSRAQLQGADLRSTQLQGVRSDIKDSQQSFADRMRNAANKETDLSEVTFTGGLNREIVDSVVENFSDEEARELRKILEPHIDKPASNELPDDSGAITEAYTEEEAEPWIAEYEEAMSAVPKADNGQ